METNRSGSLANMFSDRRSRRATLKGGAAGLGTALISGAVVRSAMAQDATPASSPVAGDGDSSDAFLFVQTASAGTFRTNPDAGTPSAADGTPTPGGGAGYLLMLENHVGETIYFADRPSRVFGQAPTQQFLDGLGFTPNNPPNAAIVANTGDGDDDVLVLELFTPVFDADANTLTYGANVLSGDDYVGGLAYAQALQGDGTISAEFTHASLFIDSCADRDVKCASNKKGVPGNWRGDLGTYSMCFFISEMACCPCGDTGWARTDQDCTNQFPDQCYVNAQYPVQCITDGVS